MPTSRRKSTWDIVAPVIRNGMAVPPTPEGTKFQQSGTQLTYTHPGVQSDTLQNLYGQQMRGEMCDVLIRVENVDFKAHKIVLAAACPYFSNLFKDVRTVRIDRLILEGLTAQSVAAMIGYFYLAKLIIDAEDVEELLEAAYYFKVYMCLLDNILSICQSFKQRNVSKIVQLRSQRIFVFNLK